MACYYCGETGGAEESEMACDLMHCAFCGEGCKTDKEMIRHLQTVHQVLKNVKLSPEVQGKS